MKLIVKILVVESNENIVRYERRKVKILKIYEILSDYII